MTSFRHLDFLRKEQSEQEGRHFEHLQWAADTVRWHATKAWLSSAESCCTFVSTQNVFSQRKVETAIIRKFLTRLNLIFISFCHDFTKLCTLTSELLGVFLSTSFPPLAEPLSSGTLRPNSVSIILNHFQPHLHTAPGSIKTEGVTVGGAGSQGERPSTSHPHTVFSRARLRKHATLLTGRRASWNFSLGGWVVVGWGRGGSVGRTSHCSGEALCSGWVQFNPYFPVAPAQVGTECWHWGSLLYRVHILAIRRRWETPPSRGKRGGEKSKTKEEASTETQDALSPNECWKVTLLMGRWECREGARCSDQRNGNLHVILQAQ